MENEETYREAMTLQMVDAFSRVDWLCGVVASPEAMQVGRLRRFVLLDAAKKGGFTESESIALFGWILGVTMKVGEGSAESMPDYELWGDVTQALAVSRRGRPVSPIRRALELDSFLLSVCSNSYSHLLQDALQLRLSRYHTVMEKRMNLRKSVKWAEVTCARIWGSGAGSERPEMVERLWWKRFERKLSGKCNGWR